MRSFRPISLPYGLERLEGNGSGREAKASATGVTPAAVSSGGGWGGAQPTRVNSLEASRDWRASFPLWPGHPGFIPYGPQILGTSYLERLRPPAVLSL